ncbi:MAG: polysaccharide export protein [Nitrospinae bacterium]|nr:polysaccharide export protein [Nitrospinota bacterium]
MLNERIILLAKKGAVLIFIGWFILIAGCLTAPAKKDKGVKTEKVVSEQGIKDEKKQIEIKLQAPPVEIPPSEPIPSYPENRVYSEALGFPEYVVGPLDVLSITFWKGTTPEMIPVLVRPDGNISFSFLENVHVTGLTPTQIDNLITDKLSEYVKKPRIDVIVKDYNSKKVSLFGAINRLQTGISGPGIYPITGKLTMLDLLLIAGGHSDQADITKVELTRKGKVHTLNLYSALFQGVSSQNAVVEAGDRIVIPDLPQYQEGKMVDRKVFILGEVKVPGLFRFKKTISVIEAISMAGGTTIHAVEEDTKILRGDEKKKIVIASNIKKFLKEMDMSQNVAIEDGDVIFVPKSKISDVSDFFNKLSPILSALLYPGLYRDTYTTGGGLRFDTGYPSQRPVTPTSVPQVTP